MVLLFFGRIFTLLDEKISFIYILDVSSISIDLNAKESRDGIALFRMNIHFWIKNKISSIFWMFHLFVDVNTYVAPVKIAFCAA
jgi:hypothetical protein